VHSYVAVEVEVCLPDVLDAEEKRARVSGVARVHWIDGILVAVQMQFRKQALLLMCGALGVERVLARVDKTSVVGWRVADGESSRVL
jgi:hypothetical protein